ncbi:hypothetical protein N1F78_09710 [Seonamhaeicola sp. MEBiC1930]|uniref:hypothetical protein n=1 Tax=Seonamhaeicola sp. MEBiC01930 TaxID=2976768 RepID=UPI00324AC478
MLDKSRRFRKFEGSYDWSKNQLKNLPKASKDELDEIREHIQKENRKSRIKQWAIFSSIFIILFAVFIYLIH